MMSSNKNTVTHTHINYSCWSPDDSVSEKFIFISEQFQRSTEAGGAGSSFPEVVAPGT